MADPVRTTTPACSATGELAECCRFPAGAPPAILRGGIAAGLPRIPAVTHRDEVAAGEHFEFGDN